MANFAYVAISLDNYLATPDGDLEWLTKIPNPSGSDFGFSEFMNRIDALVMGRHTFEVVHGFGQWPYDKRVFVLSESLTSLPASYEDKAELIGGDILSITTRLAERGFRNLYIDGGRVIQSFLKQDLIDEMIITRVPVLLGEGIPLFGSLENPKHFNRVETEVLNNLLVKSHYYK